MSEVRPRRARAPATGRRGGGSSGGRIKRRLLLASMALPVIAIAPVVWAVVTPAPSDGLQTVIREAGFDPLDPPSRLRGPGAIYEVEGGMYRKVCDAEPAMLTGKLQKSPTENHVMQRLQSGGFTMEGAFVNALNASLGDDRVVSVKYGLTDVEISEITLADLADIQDQLLRQKSCDEEVTRLLKAKHKVCSGYAALSASAYYKVQENSRLRTNARSRTPVSTAAQRALEERTQGHVEVKGDDELTGEDLYYGIQLAARCITLDTDTEPSLLPPAAAPPAAPVTPAHI